MTLKFRSLEIKKAAFLTELYNSSILMALLLCTTVRKRIGNNFDIYYTQIMPGSKDGSVVLKDIDYKSEPEKSSRNQK